MAFVSPGTYLKGIFVIDLVSIIQNGPSAKALDPLLYIEYLYSARWS